MRHGKSSWEFDVSDRERPLKQRGVTDTQLVLNQFKSYNFYPEVIFSSPANRALSTCKIFMEGLKLEDSMLHIEESLYDFSGNLVIDFIKSLPDNYKNIMLFGHNHAFTSISNIFGDKFIDNLPTAGLVKLNIDIEMWSALKKGKTELIIIPKNLK